MLVCSLAAEVTTACPFFQRVKDWKDATLKPGEKYYSHLAYKLSVKK